MDKAFVDQVNQTVAEIQAKITEFEKTVTSGDTAFPVRENLAAPAKLVVPVDTPLLNRFPTVPGSGKAAAWKEVSSFGSTPGSIFYAETGQPSGRTTVYADRSETYKLWGVDGGVTSFAVAAGANFQDQLATEKEWSLLHLKLLEEDAILNADGTGTAFSGIRTQVTTGNGSYVAASTGTAPSAVISDLDDMLKTVWDKGADISLLVVRSTEAKLITRAVAKEDPQVRIVLETRSGVSGGFFVNRYISPIDGRVAEIVADKKHTNAEILGVAERLPAPVPGQGGNGIYLDILLDYALSDVPTAKDQRQFRIKRYGVLPIPGRKFFGKITGY